eukprot:jgi/Hompol1/6517/HPOL_005005-RA
MTSLELFSWGPGFDQPSFDPACLSIAAYLNLAGADWSINECRNPGISPNGELPVLRVGVEPVVGTANIIRTLKSKGLDLDEHLSPKQRIESDAFIALIEDKLCDALMYTRWMEAQNYQKATQPTLAKSLSFFGKFTVPTQLKEKAFARLSQYRDVSVEGGPLNEVYIRARDAYQALATKLGDKSYFFGDKPSTLDAIAYGHLALHAYPSLAVPKLFTLLSFNHPNLIAYVARLKPIIFDAPLVPSPSTRPSLATMIYDLAANPHKFVGFIMQGFQPKLESQVDRRTKEERVEDFWKHISVGAAVVFFVGFVVANGIIVIESADNTEQEEQEQEEQQEEQEDVDDDHDDE